MRKVKVGLEADVAGFVGPVDTAKKSVDDLGDKVEDLDRSLNKIPTDAAKAGAALKLLGGDVDSVGTKVNSLGEKNVGLATLDAKIREAQKEVRKLGDEFVKTGDVDVFKKLGDASGRLDGLKSVRKKLADAIVITPDEAKGVFKHFGEIASQVGSETGKIFSGGLTGALSTPVLGPIIGVGLAAAIAAALTVALATAGGAVLAAGALGGVGAGVAGAVMGDSHAVAAAWGGEIEKIKAQWLGASVVFRGPLIAGAHEFGSAISEVHLDQILAKSAAYLQPLVSGAAGLAKYLGQALGVLVDGAGPAVHVLAEELPKIGLALRGASSEIASGGEGGAQALKDVLEVVERLILSLGKMVGAAEKVYGAMAKFRDWALPRDWFFAPGVLDNLQTGARVIGDTGTAAQTATVDYKAFATALNETAATADTAIGSIVDKVLDGMLAMDHATLGFEESLTRLDKTMDANGKTTSLYTEKGQANREGILAVVEANQRLFDSNIASGMSAAEATAAYEGNTEALERQLHKAHLTQGEIDDLIGKYRDVPKDVNTEVGAKGLLEVLANLNLTLQRINHLDGQTANVYLNTHITTYYDEMGLGHQGQAGRAAGGPVKAGTSYVVGEHRPEVFVPNVDGTIVPSISQYASMGSRAADMRAWGQMGTPAGAGPASITVTLVGDGDLTSAMLKNIRTEVRTGFQGNVQVALGQASR